MRDAIQCILLAACVALASGTASARHGGDDAPATTATTLLDHLDAGRYVEAEAMFSPQMSAAVPVDRPSSMRSTSA